MRVQLIFATLAAGALLLAGCGGTPSHVRRHVDRRRVVTVTGAISPPGSPKAKQLARELNGIEGEARPQVVTLPRATEKQLARGLRGVKGALP